MNKRGIDTRESLLAFFNDSYASDHFYVDENGDFNVHIKGQKTSTFHFILIPVEKVNVLDKQGNIKDMRYKFYALREGATVLLEPITILKKELHNVNWIRRWNQFAVLDSITPKSYLWILQFLNHIDKEIPTINELDLIGWHKDEQGWFFLHSGGKIGKSRQTYRTTFTEFEFLKSNSLSEEQAFKETIEMLNICDHKVTYALLSYVLLSLIVTPLVETKDLSPNFAMWIYGKSGLGKTRLSSLFTRMYDIENIVRVDSYKKDLKSAYTKHKDSVIVVDDYGTSKTTENEYRTDEKVENIIRWLGDRQLSSVDDALPTGMALFTGERFLNNNEKNSSTIARTIRIQMDNIFNRDEPGFDLMKINKFQKYEEINPLPTSIVFYVDWLSNKLNSQMIDHYRSDFHKLRMKFESKLHSRIIDSISHLFNAFNFYIMYAVEKEFLTPLESQAICENAMQLFMSILDDQSKPIIQPQVEFFLNLLTEAIKGGRINVALPDDLIYSNGRFNPSNGTLGVYYPDTEELKLIWESSYEILYKESRQRNEDLIGVKKLGKLLDEANLIIKTSSGITTPIKTWGETSACRAITFDARKIPSISELILQLREQAKQNKLMTIDEYENEPYEYYEDDEKKMDHIKMDFIGFDD
ncbi:hypothetical protein NST50_24280 [Paenibacillus sp. FSL E2-0202]|uniref:hypothetical protein n=1 Tax=unclassified Paenibacillus TaxID=185978 RepID=UPI0030EE3825